MAIQVIIGQFILMSDFFQCFTYYFSNPIIELKNYSADELKLMIYKLAMVITPIAYPRRAHPEGFYHKQCVDKCSSVVESVEENHVCDVKQAQTNGTEATTAHQVGNGLLALV